MTSEPLIHGEYGDPSMTIETTFSIIKPNAIKKNAIGAIINQFEKHGLRIAAAKLIQLTRSKAEEFYSEHKERPFFNELVDFMISSPIMILALSGEDAINKNREIISLPNISKYLMNFFRMPLSTSGISKMMCRLGDILTPVYEEILQDVKSGSCIWEPQTPKMPSQIPFDLNLATMWVKMLFTAVIAPPVLKENSISFSEILEIFFDRR